MPLNTCPSTFSSLFSGGRARETVPDISLNAVANLGYAEGRFLAPVYPGDTLTAASEVIGLRETSNGRSGVVWVRTTGFDQQGQTVLAYCRWAMVRKRDAEAPAPDPVVPELAAAVAATDLVVPPGLDFTRYHPRVIMAESTVPLTEVPTHQVWEPILIRNGYIFAIDDGLNRYYVHSSQEALLAKFIEVGFCVQRDKLDKRLDLDGFEPR